GAYAFEIREFETGAEGVAYDGHAARATVTVSKGSDGNYAAAVSYDEGAPNAFVNVYTPPEKLQVKQPDPSTPSTPSASSASPASTVGSQTLDKTATSNTADESPIVWLVSLLLVSAGVALCARRAL
ncbi:MAG: sortase B protein-sorting domain-containing protein, partial [Eggerthellaceae bacterium]|nr:sortase B protein-sorting domain-containing protein [Eggerthellaceae bacterium]